MAANCDAAFERLLEADPAELAGQGDSEVAVHVRECARCQAVGATLLGGQERLSAALTQMVPHTDVARALGAARVRRSKAQRWQQFWQWGPVAAAAAIAVVMILQALGGAPVLEGEIGPVPAAIEPLVEALAGQNVMVFETGDQSAKVIWFY
jgi:hypothetical protein